VRFHLGLRPGDEEFSSPAQPARPAVVQTPRIWTGNDGESRAAYELTARDKFLGKREGSGNGGAPNEAPPTDITDDDPSAS